MSDCHSVPFWHGQGGKIDRVDDFSYHFRQDTVQIGVNSHEII